MGAVHNLEYYTNLYEGIVEFQHNNADRSQKQKYFRPDTHLIEPLGHYLTDRIIFPLVYPLVSRYSISQSTLMKVGKRVEAYSKEMALRKPTQLPILKYLDTCRIAIARHLYITSKDTNALLSIPEKLHEYIDTSTTETTEGDDPPTIPTTLLGRGWQWIKMGTGALKNGFLTLVHRVVTAAEIPFQYMPIVNFLLKKLAEMTNTLQEKVHEKIIDVAHQVVDRKEDKIRKKITQKVIENTTRSSIYFSIQAVLKSGFGIGIYYLTHYAVSQVTGNEELFPQVVQTVSSVALPCIGGYLWLRCISPSLERIHNSYQEDFDPEASTLRELHTLLNKKNFSKVISLIREKLQ